jgi:hypothetical protein
MLAVRVFPIAIFAAFLIVSMLVKERCYPFSTLQMFSYPWGDADVLLIANLVISTVVPCASAIGASTSALSREYAVYASRGGSDEAFVSVLRGRIENHQDPVSAPPGLYFLWACRVSVNSRGEVRRDLRLLSLDPVINLKMSLTETAA